MMTVFDINTNSNRKEVEEEEELPHKIGLMIPIKSMNTHVHTTGDEKWWSLS